MVLDHTSEELLFTAAASAHSFAATPVDDAALREIYDLAKWGPTATNQQPLRLVAVRSEAAREELAGAMLGRNGDQVRGAPLVLVLLADSGFGEHLPELWPSFPAAADVFFPTPEAKAASARFNSALQLAYLIVAVRAKGLAAGPMTGYDAARLQELYGDDRHEVIAAMTIGHPTADSYHERLPRLDLDTVLRTV